MLTRNATSADLTQVVEIMNHYIQNTVISLRTELLNLSSYQEIFNSVRAQNLPFFVAEEDGQISGFAYANGFRTGYQGCRHTAEITVYVHPAYHNQGVGSRPMDTLMDALRCPKNPGAPEIKQVLSIMSLNEEGPGKGYGLRNWYGRWGFVEVGHMKRVGFKLGKWVDVLMMQVSLEQ